MIYDMTPPITSEVLKIVARDLGIMVGEAITGNGDKGDEKSRTKRQSTLDEINERIKDSPRTRVK